MAAGDITRADIDTMLAQNETARARAYQIAFERIQADARQGALDETLTLTQADLDGLLESDPLALEQSRRIAGARELADARAEIAILKAQRP